jgi:CCR4-NOT transcription complex subunit 1
MSIFGASRYPSLLPESLKLKPGGLTLSQIRVYEDFMRITVPGSPSPDSERVARVAESNLGNQTSEQPAYDNVPTAMSTQQAMEKFSVSFFRFNF